MVAAVCGTGDSGVAMVQRTGLRPSPAVHHPDPNPHALRTFAEGRYDKLHPPYDRPGTRLFQEFCDTLAATLKGIFEGVVAIAMGHHQGIFQAKLVNCQL